MVKVSVSVLLSIVKVVEVSDLLEKMEVILFIILAVLDQVRGHAIFWEPPSRASLGKHNMNFCYVPVNDDHMSLYCGGIMVGYY